MVLLISKGKGFNQFDKLCLMDAKWLEENSLYTAPTDVIKWSSLQSAAWKRLLLSFTGI